MFVLFIAMSMSLIVIIGIVIRFSLNYNLNLITQFIISNDLLIAI